MMEVNAAVLENGVKHILLEGRMDMQGVGQIDLKFTSLVSTNKAAVVVDLSEVTFLASIGIRLLLQNARALQTRGGKMVLLSPMSLVAEALNLSGISSMIPIHNDLDQACQDALAGLAP